MAEHRLMVVLNLDEVEALIRSSENEYRTPREQVRFILRNELERLGYLKNDPEIQKVGNFTIPGGSR